ncbi:DUF2384 domain-containing protein [Sphingomonas koreensis]|nr:DUF2384 domain-containing protein [Sphingomonas koreensis]
MHASIFEHGMAIQRSADALADWGLSEEECEAVVTCGIGCDEPGAAVALETRHRHIVDVDRAVGALVGRASLLPLWLRLPQDALDGLTPLELITGHVAGLRHVRQLLVRERLERGFS